MGVELIAVMGNSPGPMPDGFTAFCFALSAVCAILLWVYREKAD